VLGPVTLTSGADVVALGGPKQRLVLGLLVARTGHVVPIDDITDALWPEGPQAKPRKTVQVYVTRLRRLFAGNEEAIQGVAAGYRFDPTVVDLDAALFERALAAAFAESDDESAIARLREALGWWRGDAFADLRDCSVLIPSAVRLDGLRINAMHELFDREGRLRPHSVIAEIEHALETHPLDERFAAQLMTAQYQAGRQADALVTYQQLRRRLGDELGLEPGPAIRELQGRILRQELPMALAAVPVATTERQRRRVTIVSMSLTFVGADGDADAEEEFGVLAPLRQIARSRVIGHGGVVASETSDSLTACFGYPARPDAAVQAVTAALALRDLADPGRGVTTRAGVENGIVVLEAAGPAEATAGTVSGITGQPLRAAARLRDVAAADEVRLGPAIAGLVNDRFELHANGSDAADGVVVVRRLGPAADAPARPTSLIDRRDALESLRAIATQAVNGVRPVVVTGPPGIGKSALVEAFVDQLGSEWGTVSLHAGAGHELSPLHVFRMAVPDAFDADAEPTVHQLVTALRHRWDGRRPALVVDDVDLVDPSSWTVLDQLADHLPDGLVAMTSRQQQPLELGGEVVPAIALGPLEPTDARSLARRCAADRSLDLATLNEIVERSGGAPLHVVELTRTMTGEGAPDRMPATLYDSLMWRLDRLGPAGALVQRCAVLGGSFTVDDVVELTDAGTRTEVAAHLVELVAGGVLRETSGVFRFASALLADAAYESLLQSDRRALHDHIADAIGRSQVHQPLERLAHHLEASGRLVEAAVAWRRASSVAIRRNANREGLHHARRAIALTDALRPSDDPRVGETSARALHLLAIGLHARSYGSQELADVIARARAESQSRSLLLDLLEISNRQALGDLLGATEVAEATVSLAAEDGDEMAGAFARQFLGATLVWRGLLDAGSAALEQAVTYWDRAGVPGPVAARPVGASWALLALVHALRGNDTESTHCIERGRDVIADDDGDGKCLVAAMSAVIDQLGDRPATVRAHLEPVWLLATEIGSEFFLGWAQSLLGWAIAADDGPAGRAMMLEAREGVTTVQALPYFSYLLGSRLGEAGELDEAISRLTDGIELARTTGELLWQPLLLFERARWRDAAGDARAVDDAAEAIERADAMGAARIIQRGEAWSPKVAAR
jgi:DNA-binding SARP family transcriptional activator/tetratricopeptide (TPR) repeat protein